MGLACVEAVHSERYDDPRLSLNSNRALHRCRRVCIKRRTARSFSDTTSVFWTSGLPLIPNPLRPPGPQNTPRRFRRVACSLRKLKKELHIVVGTTYPLASMGRRPNRDLKDLAFRELDDPSALPGRSYFEEIRTVVDSIEDVPFAMPCRSNNVADDSITVREYHDHTVDWFPRPAIQDLDSDRPGALAWSVCHGRRARDNCRRATQRPHNDQSDDEGWRGNRPPPSTRVAEERSKPSHCKHQRASHSVLSRSSRACMSEQSVRRSRPPPAPASGFLRACMRTTTSTVPAPGNPTAGRSTKPGKFIEWGSGLGFHRSGCVLVWCDRG